MKHWLHLSSALLLAAPAAQAAHPLVTEDTGVQGKGGWQLELNADRFRDSGLKLTSTNAVLTYGLAEKVDVQVGSSYIDSSIGDGMADAALSLKWRAWEKDAWSLGLKPTLTLPSGRDEKRLGAGRAGANLLGMATYEGERWAFLFHAGMLHTPNVAGGAESGRQAAAAVLYRVTENLRPLLDYAYTNIGGHAIHSTTVGVIYAHGKNFDLDVGVRHGGGASPNRGLMAGVTLRW
jgi:hypothetical protein